MTDRCSPAERRIGEIPVQNLWFLMLYASDVARWSHAFDAITDDDIDDIPDLIARLLTNAVERRLRRNLTRGYHHQEKALARVRGRIDFLATDSRQLFSRGEVFCRYEESTLDTPRNRLVRAALERMVRLVRSTDRSRECRALATTLGRAGVGGQCPSRSAIAADQIGRNDAPDRLMVALARLAFDLALPTEDAGATALVCAGREEAWVRRLFEKAILGFARIELEPRGWSVRGSLPFEWQFSSASSQLVSILPRMVTDIVLDAPSGERRLIIDTKFTCITRPGQYGNERLKSGYIYQMYAYLRSQESRDSRSDTSAGLLLHPAIRSRLQEHVIIQGHPIAFATVDLAAPSPAIRSELRRILCIDYWGTGEDRLTRERGFYRQALREGLWIDAARAE